MTRAIVFPPVFSSILRHRQLGVAIGGLAFLQLLLVFSRLPSWPCPFFHASGLPCPGCGMTRATLLLFQGEWRQAFTMHAFAPVFLLALIVITACAIAPRNYVSRLADRAELLERYTGITALILIGLVLYWLARLLILQTDFVRLIQG